MTGGGDSPRASYLEVDGMRIRCFCAGEGGRPVMLVHGGGFDSALFSFRHTIGHLSASHRVFAPDLPGYGESEGPPGGLEPGIGFYAGFLGRMMDSLGLERTSLVGISMGGGAALGFALRSPERVERLVLVDSLGLGSRVPLAWLGYLVVRVPPLSSLARALLRRSRWVIRASLRSAVHDPQVVTGEMVEEACRLRARPAAGRAFWAFVESEVRWNGLRTDFSGRLHEVRAPTLIVHGACDRAVPVRWAMEAHRRIRNSRLYIVERCGHVPPVERPQEFNRVVERFLGESTNPGADR